MSHAVQRAAWVALGALLVVLATRPAPAQPAMSREAVQAAIDEAARHFESGDFAAARDEYLRAHEASGYPPLLYMIGRCHEELGAWAQAESYLTRFLATPGLPLDARAKAEEALAEVRERGAGAAATSEPQPPREATPPAAGAAPAGSRTDFAPWAWGTLGGGAALVAGGAVAFVYGKKDHDEVRDAPGYDDGGVVQMTKSRARDLEASGNAKKVTGYVLWGLGGAAVVASTVLFVLAADGEAPVESVHVGVGPTPGGSCVFVGGRF